MPLIKKIYCEEEIAPHPRAMRIQERFPEAVTIPCHRYGEVFNPKNQNFRLQKKDPALILAKKHQGWVLPTPKGYGIGGEHNYYFSHMLNCIYDCRYCFLQGMYRSANYVVFANFEDFFSEIDATLESHPQEEVYFFSGYDCDSLALEPITHFTQEALPFFSKRPQGILELRTKSRSIQPILNHSPFPNCVVAFTLSPHPIAAEVEKGAPSTLQRIRAMKALQEAGWKVGLRFDPLLYLPDFKHHYSQLFEEVFHTLSLDLIHSVSLGLFRLPKGIYNNIRRLYPKEKLFTHSLEVHSGSVSYSKQLSHEMRAFCLQELRRYVPEELLFPIGEEEVENHEGGD